MCLERSERNDKNYELIEYLNDVNREHAEVLVEQNINGRTDTSYIYGAEINGGFDRISLDRFDGSTGYYLYDARGSVSGITNEEGQVYQSYRYSVTGEITFGAPQYENEYTYNGESYNPNIESQYLRARYYCVVTATFLTEDSYLGSLTEPLTLNRYNYCVSSYLNYTDPSGNSTENDVDRILREYPILSNQKSEQAIAVESFVNGVLGSAAKVIIDKPTAAYMPGMAMEELYGGQYRFNERAYNNYVNLTETLIEALSKDATNKTAYYAGRCTGDVVITAVGGVEFVYGLITTISGGSGSAAALATGIGIAAEPVTIAVTAEGVVTVVDGVNTIHYGITAFKKDADKGKEAKEADSKAAESGTPSTTDRIRNVAQQSFDYAVNNPRKQGLNRMQLGKDAEIQATRWTRKWAERNGIDLSESGLHFQVRGEHSIPDVVYEPTKNIMDFKLTPKAVRKKQSDNFKSDFPGYSIEYIFGPGPWREQDEH